MEESMEIEENNSSGNSTPYLNGSPCYSSEDELPALGQFLSTTPKKQEVKETDDDLNDTPPLSNSNSFSTSFSTPPRLAVPKTSTLNLSPIANVQPTNVIINDEKENVLSDDLLKKCLTRVASSRESQRRQDKIQELQHSGGVLAMSRRTDQKINQVKEEINNLRINNPQDKKDLEHSVVDLPVAPGVKYFTCPPHFHAGFIKCSETGNPSIDKITSESSNYTNINQFMFVLNGKLCPTPVILWLMDNACLSNDVMTRHTSLLTLAQIASICTSVSSPIDIGDFHMLISKLGAIVQPARAGDLQHQNSEVITTEVNGCSNPRVEDHQTTPELLQNSIANFCKAVLIIFQHFHSLHSTPALIKGLAFLLLDIALDPVVCSNFVCEDISLCLQTVLLSAAELDWEHIQSDILSYCTRRITSNHQNQYHIVTLLSSPSTRIRLLQYTLVRVYLTGTCVPEGGDAQLQDIVLASKVINHYYEQQDLDFKELHSMMKMLSILLLSSKMQWNSAPDLDKKYIVNMLSKLTGSIKDNLPGVILERGPIKDFIISLNLELQQTGKCGRREMTQTSISDYILDKD